MNIVRHIVFIVIVAPIVSLCRIFGSTTAKNIMETYNGFIQLRNWVKNAEPEFKFKFDGIDGVVSSDYLAATGHILFPDMMAAVVVSLGFGNYVIVTSMIPDFSNAEHVSILWHEIGHIRHHHFEQIRKATLTSGFTGIYVDPEMEMQADKYAANKMGNHVVIDFLRKAHERIEDPAHRELITTRIQRLSF